MNSMKRVILTVIALSILASMFALKPSVAVDQRGPVSNIIRQKVTRSPASQLIEMTTGASELWRGLIRPTDLEEMDRQGKTISSRGGFHYCRIVLNYRRHPLDDVNYRHALFHLLPKDRIIGNLFKYVVVKIDTPVPPAQALWYNPAVDPHPYSPAEAESILADAGYQKIGGEWKDKDGSNLPTLQFYVPLEVVAPTSYTVGRMLAEEAQGIGLNNVVVAPTDFATYVDKMFNYWDFDIAWVCHSLTRFPTHLFYQFSSEENYLGSSNPTGIVYPELDAKLSILLRSLDHAAKVTAVREAQVLIAGGDTTNPLPHNVLDSDPRSQALPTMSVYSRNYYDVEQPYLRGAVNMFGYGVDNIWTLMNIYKTQAGTVGDIGTVVYIEDDYPERLNPHWASTVYAWDYLGPVTSDALIAVNPYTHRDEPWLANSWSYAATPGGMDVNFEIRLTDPSGSPITYADGKAISINDIKFSWDFITQFQIPQWWGAFRFYDSATITDATHITAHMTTASQWLFYDLAGEAYIAPPQVWTVDPRDGQPWTGLTEITTFDPSSIAYPTAYNTAPGPIALPTQVFGVAPFILQHSTNFVAVNGYGDVVANRNYWLTTAEIGAKIDDMFWRAGDTDKNKVINVADLDMISVNYGMTVPPANSNADITGPAGSPPDSLVDIDDLATAGKYFGETETILP